MQKMISKTYPSITSLRCFEASARFLSFTKAAQVLYMTQSAISKQVAQLEDSLKIQLFERSLQGLKLTPAGNLFFIETKEILSQIELSVLNLQSHESNVETLNILVHTTLCARWLVPVLKGFGKAHPNIHLDIQEQITSSEIENSKTHIAFLYGEGVWRDMTSIKLFTENCIAVCSPDLINKPFNNILEFENYVLIQSKSRPRAWDEYFQSQSCLMKHSFVGPRFDTFYACIHAAMIGCGIALVPKLLVENELKNGDLLTIWSHEFITQKSYYMIFPSSMENTPKVSSMVEWIKNKLNCY